MFVRITRFNQIITRCRFSPSESHVRLTRIRFCFLPAHIYNGLIVRLQSLTSRNKFSYSVSYQLSRVKTNERNKLLLNRKTNESTWTHRSSDNVYIWLAFNNSVHLRCELKIRSQTVVDIKIVGLWSVERRSHSSICVLHQCVQGEVPDSGSGVAEWRISEWSRFILFPSTVAFPRSTAFT